MYINYRMNGIAGKVKKKKKAKNENESRLQHKRMMFTLNYDFEQ